MENKERLEMAAPCGIDCGICELYVCNGNPELFDYLVSKGIPKESLPCLGCRKVEGKCPVIGATCETYKCFTEKKIGFCFECREFPCSKLQPSADRANVLPHNLKVFNLCKIQNYGLEEFVEKSMKIRQLYFKGKMIIGAGPVK